MVELESCSLPNRVTERAWVAGPTGEAWTIGLPGGTVEELAGAQRGLSLAAGVVVAKRTRSTGRVWQQPPPRLVKLSTPAAFGNNHPRGSHMRRQNQGPERGRLPRR